MKILFVAADVQGNPQLALSEEFRTIQGVIQASRFRDTFEIIPQLAARPGDLRRALLQHRPDIVHVACHGRHDSELVLLPDDGCAAPVSDGSLAAYVRILQDNIALVVLNACWSSRQAEAIRSTVDMTIGMRQRISDGAAGRFSGAFYEGLAYGRSVRHAFELGAVAIGDAQDGAPELFERDGVRASAICFAGDPPDGASTPERRVRWRFWVGAIAIVVAISALVWRVSVALAEVGRGSSAVHLARVAAEAYGPLTSSAAKGAAAEGAARPADGPPRASAGAPLADAGELALEVTPIVSGSRSGSLRSGDEVVSRDEIQVAVRPTADARVYVAYCTRGHRLALYPHDGGVAAPAGLVTYVPRADLRIVLDDEVGPEVLYVIASRKPLDLVDRELAVALSRAQPGAALRCGAPLDRLLESYMPRPSPAGALASPEPRAGSAAPRTARARPPVELADFPDETVAGEPVRGGRAQQESYQRGLYIPSVAMDHVPGGGDHQDIVVRRYNFTHAARRFP